MDNLLDFLLQFVAAFTSFIPMTLKYVVNGLTGNLKKELSNGGGLLKGVASGVRGAAHGLATVAITGSKNALNRVLTLS